MIHVEFEQIKVWHFERILENMGKDTIIMIFMIFLWCGLEVSSQTWTRASDIVLTALSLHKVSKYTGCVIINNVIHAENWPGDQPVKAGYPTKSVLFNRHKVPLVYSGNIRVIIHSIFMACVQGLSKKSLDTVILSDNRVFIRVQVTSTERILTIQRKIGSQSGKPGHGKI